MAEKKIGIVALYKLSREYFELTEEEKNKDDRSWQEFLQKWEGKVKTVATYHSVGMGKFDYLSVSEVTDIGDWEAFNEELVRKFGRDIAYSKVHIGINTPYLEHAAKDVQFFVQ